LGESYHGHRFDAEVSYKGSQDFQKLKDYPAIM